MLRVNIYLSVLYFYATCFNDFLNLFSYVLDDFIYVPLDFNILFGDIRKLVLLPPPVNALNESKCRLVVLGRKPTKSYGVHINNTTFFSSETVVHVGIKQRYTIKR